MRQVKAIPAGFGIRAFVIILALLVVFGGIGLLLWHRASPRTIATVEYPMLESNDVPTMIAASPDGAVWFTIDSAAAVGRIQDGKMLRLPKPARNLEPIGLAVAPDGAAWYTDGPAKVVSRMSPSGDITSVDIDTPIARLGQIALAPNGAAWFAEPNAFSVTRLKDGVLKRHLVDSARPGLLGIAVAADGTVWATDQGADQIVRIGVDGVMRTYEVPTRGSSPSDIAVDAKGTVWFLEFRGNKLGRLQDGKFEEFSFGEQNVGPTGIAVAPDGSIWFCELRTGGLGRFRDGKIEVFKLKRENARPYSVSVDRAGNVWYADITGWVGKFAAGDAKR